jgi:hypothetical protein
MKTREHFIHFVVLVIMLSVASVTILYYQSDRMVEVYLTIAMAAAYVLWGIVHHLKIGDLHGKIVAEYILMATLGSMILLSVIR